MARGKRAGGRTTIAFANLPANLLSLAELYGVADLIPIAATSSSRNDPAHSCRAACHRDRAGLQALRRACGRSSASTSRFQQGEFFALLGPNGAGKTTLISILAGLARAAARHAQGDGPRRGGAITATRGARSASCRRNSCSIRSSRCARRCRFQSGYFGLRDNDAWIDEVMEQLDLDESRRTPTCARSRAA